MRKRHDDVETILRRCLFVALIIIAVLILALLEGCSARDVSVHDTMTQIGQTNNNNSNNVVIGGAEDEATSNKVH